MKKIEIYTMDHCPYCDMAKALLNQRGISYEEHFVDRSDSEKRLELVQKSRGMKTLPQIYVEGEILGGYTELAKQDKLDLLSSLKL